ncbi:MAG: PEP-CTERM sorting domain-containing protein [Cephaloticoccus sp.]|nr:PEP-CTERM sorting domain-containing protein [Cephaloticoccus sp.]
MGLRSLGEAGWSSPGFAVPEPATYAVLFGLAAHVFTAAHRRKL